MSGLEVENAKKCTLLVLLTPYVNDIGYCYGKSYFRVSFVWSNDFAYILGNSKTDLEQTF